MLGMSWEHVLVIAVVGMFVFGPERLPALLRDAARMLRQLRQMADGVRDDLRSELGPEITGLDLQSLHPRTLLAELGEETGVEPSEEAAPPAEGMRLENTAPPTQADRFTPYDADAT